MIAQLPTVLLDLFEDRMESLLDAMVLEIKVKATAAEVAAATEADMKAVAAEAKEAEVVMKVAEAVDFLLAVVVVEVLQILILVVAPVEDSLLRLRAVVAAAVEAVEPVEPQVEDQRLSLIDVYKMVALLVEVVQKMPPLVAPEPPIV